MDDDKPPISPDILNGTDPLTILEHVANSANTNLGQTIDNLADKRIIIAARIIPMPTDMLGLMPTVFVTVDGQEKEIKLFDYFPTELSFTPDDFIGYTVTQAVILWFAKDLQFSLRPGISPPARE